MTLDGSLLAWIEPRGEDDYVGAYVGEGARRHEGTGRLPAVQHCSTDAEARRWVESQAAALGLPVKWVDPL